MPLEPHWDFSEWVHTHSQWQNASLSGQRECDSGGLTLWMMNCVLCGWSAPQWAVLFKLTTSLCSYMTKLSYPLSWSGKSWQEDACELLGATSAPYPLWREKLWQPGVLHESLDRLNSFWNVLFEATKHSGSVGDHGGSEEETEREC